MRRYERSWGSDNLAVLRGRPRLDQLSKQDQLRHDPITAARASRTTTGATNDHIVRHTWCGATVSSEPVRPATTAPVRPASTAPCATVSSDPVRACTWSRPRRRQTNASAKRFNSSGSIPKGPPGRSLVARSVFPQEPVGRRDISDGKPARVGFDGALPLNIRGTSTTPYSRRSQPQSETTRSTTGASKGMLNV